MADWRRMRIWASAHAIDDLYQGLVPATVPYFVLERHFSYAAASGLALAATAPRGTAAHTGTDRPRLFTLLIAVEIVRSTVSFGINTFVSLYWIRELGGSTALGGTALALVLGGGVLGTLLGGRIADRLGLVRTVQLGNALLVPALAALVLCRDRHAALGLALVAGVVINIPFAVLIKLGQDYLPSRPGTAAGVTLGLAVSAGGLLMPVLGVLADHHGPAVALTVLAAAPILAFALSSELREPAETLTAPILERSVERREEEP